MTEIDDLVSRLRRITGYTARTPELLTKASTVLVEQHVSSDSLLFLQQSLRRHPCFGVFGLPRAEVDCQLLRELDDAAATPAAAPPAADATTSAVAWRLLINEVAETLEVERLAGVFLEPALRMEKAREALFSRLGVLNPPLLSQVSDGYPCPWNVLATLENGVLFDQDDFREFAKATLRVPNATTGIQQQLQKVQEDSYHTLAWLQLLHQMMRFPIASVRTVWQAALFHFPTSAPLVCVYVRLELAALAKKARLDACRAETDAKDVYKDYLRILNCFYRHLPLIFSCELYSIFFTFVTDYVQPDNTSLDLLFRTCLRRDVGMLPQSTKLWRQYLGWRPTTIRDHTKRREWRKRMFHRILAIPLLNLDEVKKEYDMFVEAEYRGRVAPDEKTEVEKRLDRVKATAEDVARQMKFFYPAEWEPASQLVTFPHTLYLARPLVVDGPLDPNSIKEAVLSRIEMDLWASWYTLLQSVRRPLFPGSGGDVFHYSRCRSFMAMAAAFFPHQPTLWMEAVDFCVNHQPLLSDKERFSSVAAAIDFATVFQRHDVCVRLFVAQTYLTDLTAPDLAFRDMKATLLHLRGWLLHFVRDDDATATQEEAMEKLQHITVVAVNFMRMGSAQGEAQHILLVARFVMHQVEFLVLTMAVLRKLFRADAIHSPAPFLRPFYLFCAQWISLELIRSRAATSAALVLQQWCEHLKLMLQSGKAKGWTCEECGLDELLLDTCSSLLIADPTTSATVDATLAQLEAVVSSGGGLRPGNFIYLARQLRHRFFLSCPPPPAGDISDVSLVAKLLLPHAAPHRYDTVQFRCPLPRFALASEDGEGEEAEGERVAAPSPAPSPSAAAEAEEDADEADTRAAAAAAEAAASSSRRATVPNEGMWSSAVALRNEMATGRPRFDRPRRPPFTGRFQDANDGVPKELPRVPVNGPSRLAVLTQSLHLPTLLDCLGSGGKAATKLPPLDRLEAFIEELPSTYEYNAEIVEGASDVATQWVLQTLLSCEALS